MSIRFLSTGPVADRERIGAAYLRVRNLRPHGFTGPSDDEPARVLRWRTVAQELEEQISLGHFAKGARLPSEAAIAGRHGVTRRTVRHAFAKLAQRGLIRCTPGLGAFVASPRLTYSLDESASFSENVLRAGRKPGHRMVSIEETFAPAEVTAWLDIARRARVLEIRHVGTANDVPVCVSTSWFPADRCARVGEFFARTNNLAQALRLLGIPKTLRAMTRVTARLADVRERSELQLKPPAIVSVIETLDTDGKGEPVQAAYTSFPSDHVEIVIGK